MSTKTFTTLTTKISTSASPEKSMKREFIIIKRSRRRSPHLDPELTLTRTYNEVSGDPGIAVEKHKGLR